MIFKNKASQAKVECWSNASSSENEQKKSQKNTNFELVPFFSRNVEERNCVCSSNYSKKNQQKFHDEKVWEKL